MLDLKQLVSSKQDRQEFCDTASFENQTLPNGGRFILPVKIALTAEREGERVRVEVKCEAVCEGECARCLGAVSHKYTTNRVFYLKEQMPYADEEEELPVIGVRLDLAELAWQELLLSLPMVLYCDENCEGLCPVCGKPQKLGCNCMPTAIDPRLEILKNLTQ